MNQIINDLKKEISNMKYEKMHIESELERNVKELSKRESEIEEIKNEMIGMSD